MTEHKLAKGSLSGHHRRSAAGGSEEPKEGEHAATVRKLHHGYHVTRHHRDGSKTEHAANDLDEAMDHVIDHMQSDHEGEPMEQEMEGMNEPEEGQAPPEQEPEQ